VSAPVPDAPSSFGARAARGTLWTALRYAAESALRLGGNLILTRLLFPEAFGLMALVNVLMIGLAMFSDIGLATSVVQSPRGDEPRFLRTAWTLQVLRGALLFGFACALAGVMADVYEQPELRGLVAATGASALIAGFHSMSLIRMQRHLELGRLAAIELAAQLVALAVMIGWALYAPSVWALVGGAIAASGVKLAASYAWAAGTPAGFAWDRDSAQRLLHFGKWVFLSTILFFLAGQVDRLVFGKLLSVAELGVYGIALVLAGMPTQLLWSVGNFVLLPAFSRKAEVPGALEASYLSFQRPVLLAGALPSALLLGCGPELIALLYDPRYADAGWMLQLLALGVWLQIPQTLSANVLLGVGAPVWVAVGNGAKLAAMLVLLPGGFALAGVPGAIAGFSAAEAFRWACLAVSVRRRGLPVWSADLACTAFVLAAAVAGRLAIARIEPTGHSVAYDLLVGLLAITGVWCFVSALAMRREIPDLWARLRGAF
jgi:O-antigen/teichoic acid export membrane protein